MTNFLFWDDPYLTTLDTTIVSLEGDLVILKRVTKAASLNHQ
jgi:hypothetical protein